jgi:hypothetical protein
MYITISPNNLEHGEVDGDEHARQSFHKGSDTNATIVRLSKEEQSKYSPGESTLRINHRDAEERRNIGRTASSSRRRQ